MLSYLLIGFILAKLLQKKKLSPLFVFLAWPVVVLGVPVVLLSLLRR